MIRCKALKNFLYGGDFIEAGSAVEVDEVSFLRLKARGIVETIKNLLDNMPIPPVTHDTPIERTAPELPAYEPPKKVRGKTK